MLKIGNKLKMIKQIGPIYMTGYEFEITDIQDDVISVKSAMGYGFMSMDEIGTNFIKVKTWTKWINSGFLKYKTDNEKYVRVRIGDLEAKSSCHPCDEFSLEYGIYIALQKIYDKKNKMSHDECLMR